MAEHEFPLSVNRRRLLASAMAATATAVLPGAKRADAAAPDFFRSGQLKSKAEPAYFCAATARRLAEIARRNEIRREANLPLLSVPKELRRMKKQQLLEEFGRFEIAHGKAVWAEVLKSRREVEGSNWRPTNWMEGMAYQNRVRKILWQQLRASRQVASVNSVEVVLANRSQFQLSRGDSGGVLPLPAPAKQTHRAEAGGEEREGGWKASLAQDSTPVVAFAKSKRKQTAYVHFGKAALSSPYSMNTLCISSLTVGK
jgi:hypothetical protein